MALAMKCDRCGKLYEHYGNTNVADKANAIKLIYQDESCKQWVEEYMDLCPECLFQLIVWIDNVEKEK